MARADAIIEARGEGLLRCKDASCRTAANEMSKHQIGLPFQPLIAPRTPSLFVALLLLLTLKLELGSPDPMAELLVKPIHFTSILARLVALRLLGNLYASLIAATPGRVGGRHRRDRTDYGSAQDNGRVSEQERGPAEASTCTFRGCFCHD